MHKDKEKKGLTPNMTTMGKVDSRPQKGLWGPGHYANTCIFCKERFIGDKRAHICADCAYRPDRAILNDDGIVTIDNIALPVKADDDFTTTEWDKILDYYPKYVRWCEDGSVMPMDTLAYVMGFCRKLEEAEVERDGKLRPATSWFWRISDHFGRQWFNERVLGEAAKYLTNFWKEV